MKTMRRLLFGLPIFLVLGCPSKDEATPSERLCNTAQPLTAAPVFGTSIVAAKTIALTFDDGPGSQTSDLSTYLKSQGIRATFFVNNNAQQATWINVLPQLYADGHVIGNHTKNHLNLATGLETGGLTAQQIIDELTDVDTLITPYVPNNRYLFRAPFGAWSTEVHDALKTSPMNKYVGPIEWEMGDSYQGVGDTQCWQDLNYTTKQCGDAYYTDITTNNGTKGIVLLHDYQYGDADNHTVDAGIGNTVDMIKYLVPKLKADGYTFITVDEIPEIAAVLPPLPPKDAGAEGGEGGTSSSGGASSSGGSSGATSSSGGSSSGSPCP